MRSIILSKDGRRTVTVCYVYKLVLVITYSVKKVFHYSYDNGEYISLSKEQAMSTM